MSLCLFVTCVELAAAYTTALVPFLAGRWLLRRLTGWPPVPVEKHAGPIVTLLFSAGLTLRRYKSAQQHVRQMVLATAYAMAVEALAQHAGRIIELCVDS